MSSFLDATGLAYLWGKIVDRFAPLASPALTGTPTAPTASAGTNTTQIATTAFVEGEIGALTASDVDAASSSHVHGNVSNAGAITSDTAAASGDKIILADSSDSNKLIRSGISFDGSTTNKYLTPKGTWELTKVLRYTSASFSSLSQTFTVSGCTANMVVIGYTLSNPAAQTGDWTITTAAGQVTVAGTISGSTTLTLVLAEA